jgi:hypothetical protein
MGCDIHLFVEIKINDKWEFYRQIHMPCYYRLFAKMADVRNDFNINPISYPKGTPEEISKITIMHFNIWRKKAHHNSWFNQSEIKQTMDYIKDNYKGNKSALMAIIGYLLVVLL